VTPPAGYTAPLPQQPGGYAGWPPAGRASDPAYQSPSPSPYASPYQPGPAPTAFEPAPQPPGGGPRRPGGMILATAALAVAIVAAGGYIGFKVLHSASPAPAPSHSPSASAPGSPSTSPSTGSAPPQVTTTPPGGGGTTTQQAAQNLASLLASSVSDRISIDNAYNDVTGCGPNLSQDAATFQQAASSRQQLLGKLNSMPGLAALPASMISSLSQAWQASISVDQDYASWANDEASGSCDTATVDSDSNFQNAIAPNNAATQNKTAFVGSWNPIAAQYGLTQYQQDQL
jgi:hypothetical protein